MAAQYTSKIRKKSNGDLLEVASGGVIDILAGGALKIAGSPVSLVTAPVAGVAAGYKVARGTVTPAAASQAVVTGLATVVSVVVSHKVAATVTHMFNAGTVGDQAGSPAAGSFTLTTQKPTAVNDVTPIDATTPWHAVDWIAIGT